MDELRNGERQRRGRQYGCNNPFDDGRLNGCHVDLDLSNGSPDIGDVSLCSQVRNDRPNGADLRSQLRNMSFYIAQSLQDVFHVAAAAATRGFIRVRKRHTLTEQTPSTRRPRGPTPS